MTHNRYTKRGRRAGNRRVWVFSQLNHDLTPEQYMKVVVLAGLEQARLETEAQQQSGRDEDAADVG